MVNLTWASLALALLQLALAAELRGQAPSLEDPPRVFVPRKPPTRQEMAQREACKLYGLGQMRLREDRLIEAIRLFEEALTLDPEASSLHKGLVPLYLALSRPNDALKACRRALELDPGDYNTWAVYARQLRNRGQLNEARAALVRAVACQGVGDRVDVLLQLRYDLGVLCEETQAYEEAVAAFAQVVKLLENSQGLADLDDIDPKQLKEQAANTYERMIKLCIDARLHDRALAYFREGVAKYPGLARRLNFNVAKVELAQGLTEQARRTLEAYLQTQPQGVDGYELWISILELLERHDEILSGLEDYARRDSKHVALQLLLARQYAAARRIKDARALYLRLAEESPSPEIYRGLFSLDGDNGNLRGVLQLFNEAIGKAAGKEGEPGGGDAQFAAKARAMLLALREDPALSKALVPVGLRWVNDQPPREHSLVRQTQYLLAVFARNSHQLAEAEEFYRRCLEEADEQRESLLYAGLLEVLEEARKFEVIVAVCRQGILQAKATNHHLFYRYLSHALVILGKIDEAIAAGHKAVELAAEDYRLSARLSLVRVLTQGERYDEALAECNALLRGKPRSMEVHQIRLELYQVYSAKREFTKAEDQLQLILKDEPDDALAHNNLGYLWADQGKNLDEAERLIRKAIELDEQQKRTRPRFSMDDDRENYAYLDSLGWVLFRKGQFLAAKGWLERALALTGGEDDPTIWDHLGDVHARLNEPARARAAWQRALKLYQADRRKRADDHYLELKHKLQHLTK
jgi:tetratricopeptide (TPR) repeat protein